MASPRAAWLLAFVALVFPAAADARVLQVDASAAGCADTRAAADVRADAPWCSLTPAARQALPGDEVRVAPGVYSGTFRPYVSGTPAAPIRVVGPGTVLDAGGAANAVRLIGVDDWRFEGVRMTGGANQGAWVESTHRIEFRGVSASGNPGAGIQLKYAAGTVIADSVLEGNGSAGVMETAGTTATRISGNRIAGNGLGIAQYNGDGIQLGGTGATVAGNTITGNGQPGLYEHGIYAAAAATGWNIVGNTIAGSGAANVKASGAGSVRGNRLVDGTYGLVLAGDSDVVDVAGNVITGHARHLVLALAGARGRLVHNTVLATGGTVAGADNTAVNLKVFDAIEFRNNLACYGGTDDLGVALWLGTGGVFVADANWFCSRDARGRHVGLDGARRDGATWRAMSGGDARSVFSTPPLFDADARVVGPLVGAGIGDPLVDVAVDFDGVAWPAIGSRDVGAYRFAEADGGSGVVVPGDGGDGGGGSNGGIEGGAGEGGGSNGGTDGGGGSNGGSEGGAGEGGGSDGGTDGGGGSNGGSEGGAGGGGGSNGGTDGGGGSNGGSEGGAGGGGGSNGGIDGGAGGGGGSPAGGGGSGGGGKSGAGGGAKAARNAVRIRLSKRAARRALARRWVRVPRRSFRRASVTVRVGGRVAARRRLATARPVRVALPRWSRRARPAVTILVRPR
jgi:hypothetical protein